MEQLSLGTKSTRHEIINKLYYRKYITLSPLAPTPIAIAVIDALEDCEVVNPKMTATLEQNMDLITEGKKTLDETVSESRQMLTSVMGTLEKEKDNIRDNIKKAQMKQNTVGNCNKCGKPMVVRVSKKNKRFVGCTGFPDCKNTYSLPQKGTLLNTEKTCEECNAPIVKIKSKGKRAWSLCINNNCSANKPSSKK